jgi:hypothetical protein
MQSAYSKHVYVLQVFEWLPQYYTNTSLPEEMPEDLKNSISYTLSSSPKRVSVSLRSHKKSNYNEVTVLEVYYDSYI